MAEAVVSGAEQLMLTERGSEPFLLQELRRAFPSGAHTVLSPGLVKSDFLLQPEAPLLLVFSQQLLPNCQPRAAASINAWAQQLLADLASLPDAQPWALHIFPHYGGGGAGQNRCALVYEALSDVLKRKRRHFLKHLQRNPEPLRLESSLVQFLLAGPETGFISIAPAPAAYQLRGVLSMFPEGNVPVASDKSAPSRAFAKLVEVEQRLGQRIQAGETCVDLGASPGSWSYVALNRGARVLAVDRAPLREDLMSHPRLVFQRGDAFAFEPDKPVDWLLCDVIAAPERNIQLLLRWARERAARKFVVTIKFKGTEDYGLLEQVKHALPPLCDNFYLTRLTANRNEVCAFGVTRSR